jgi:uncharacterized transporter YbjL
MEGARSRGTSIRAAVAVSLGAGSLAYLGNLAAVILGGDFRRSVVDGLAHSVIQPHDPRIFGISIAVSVICLGIGLLLGRRLNPNSFSTYLGMAAGLLFAALILGLNGPGLGQLIYEADWAELRHQIGVAGGVSGFLAVVFVCATIWRMLNHKKSL